MTWKASTPVEFADLQDVVALVWGQRAKESLALKQISATSASPETHKARMNAHGESSEPRLELRLIYAKPVK
jgi:hypothetical protein